MNPYLQQILFRQYHSDYNTYRIKKQSLRLQLFDKQHLSLYSHHKQWAPANTDIYNLYLQMPFLYFFMLQFAFLLLLAIIKQHINNPAALIHAPNLNARSLYIS